MSQENMELAYRAFDALNRRELDAFLALMADDIEVVLARVPSRADSYRVDKDFQTQRNAAVQYYSPPCPSS